MADCALCGHPRDDHTPRCTRPIPITATCGCPYEPPEDEENN